MINVWCFYRYKDNVRIDENEHISIEKLPGGAQTLVIMDVTPTDAGRYKAAASSPAGKASCAADLVILEGTTNTNVEHHFRIYFFFFYNEAMVVATSCHLFISSKRLSKPTRSICSFLAP